MRKGKKEAIKMTSGNTMGRTGGNTMGRTDGKQLIVRSNLAGAEKRKQRAGNAVVTATKLTKEKVAKEQLPEGETKVLKPKIACLKGKSTR